MANTGSQMLSQKFFISRVFFANQPNCLYVIQMQRNSIFQFLELEREPEWVDFKYDVDFEYDTLLLSTPFPPERNREIIHMIFGFDQVPGLSSCI